MDAPTMLEVPPPPRWRRRAGVAVAIAVAVGAGLAVQQRGGEDPATTTDGRLGLLSRAATDADRLPDWVARDEAMLVDGIDTASARLARIEDGRRWFLASARKPGPGGGLLQRLCLISVPDAEPPLPAPTAFLGTGGITSRATAAYACGQPNALRRQFLVFRTSRIAPADVAGIVPDGYDRVAAGAGPVEVTGNVFVIPAGNAVRDPLVATGPGGRREAYAGVGDAAAEPDVTPPGLRVRISALTRPQRPSDLLPPDVAAVLGATSAPGAQPHLIAGSERALGTGASGTRYWFVGDRRYRPGLVLVEAGPAGLVASQEVPRPSNRDPVNGVVLSTRPDPFGPAEVQGWLIVPDGFTSATVQGRAVPLAGNALVFRETLASGSAVVELRGPAGTVRRTVGDATPPTQPMLPLPTNHIPLAALPALRTAAGARFGTFREAVIAAGSAGAVEAVTGRVVPSGSRLVWVVMATGPGGGFVVVADSHDRDEFDVLDRFAIPRPLDLGTLTRARPLDLGR
ncbi:MAG: hypothetical protein U0237_13100 [Thermoleophilia bacterium]